MFGLFRKNRQEQDQWSFFMGWRVLTYQVGEKWLSLQIEPMARGSCRVYVPSEWAWRAQAPDWASDQRKVILSRLKRIEWNRDIEWPESDKSSFWTRHVEDPIYGSLESTPGGRELENMRFFQPESRGNVPKNFAKEAWCGVAVEFALQASGRVTLDVSETVEGSVFREIELPALRKNPNVVLDFIGGPTRS